MTTQELKLRLEEVRSFLELKRFDTSASMAPAYDHLNRILTVIDRGETFQAIDAGPCPLRSQDPTTLQTCVCWRVGGWKECPREAR